MVNIVNFGKSLEYWSRVVLRDIEMSKQDPAKYRLFIYVSARMTARYAFKQHPELRD